MGGEAATQGQFGYMAFVVDQITADEATLCSGTVVSPNVVLTAAHCVTDESTGTPLDPAGFEVVTGSADWTDAAIRSVTGVSRVIVDPAYNPATHFSDAALLVLSTPTTAPSVALANSADLSLQTAGTGSVISGWGETFQGSGVTKTLQWAETVVQSPTYCGQFDSGFEAALQICTVDFPLDDTATCNGDSGGPLLAVGPGDQAVEIGITDFGPTDCDTVSADYFTAVEPLEVWAASEIDAAAPPPPAAPPPTPPASPPPASSPPPTSTTPTATPPPESAAKLPRMTLSDARSDTRRTLVGAFGKSFDPRHRYRSSCRRASATRFNCRVTFSSATNDYSGDVTVYLVGGSGGQVRWSDRYAIHWVNDRCYLHSGHRRTCKVHSKRGTY